VWNGLAAVAFALLWGYLSFVAALGGPSRVAVLDRAGVIDEADLRVAYPSLVVNLRHDLGMWIAQKERRSGVRGSQIGLGVALVNLAVLVVFRTAQGRDANLERDTSGQR